MNNENLLKAFESMQFDANPEGMTRNSRVLLIDSLNTFIRSYCAVPTMDDSGNQIGGTTGFLKSVGSVIRKYHPTRVILVWDGKGGSQRRRQMYPEYKSNRKVATRLNRPQDFKTDEQESENMTEQLQILGQLIQHLPVASIQIDGVEADDIIGYLSQHITAKNPASEVIIYSTDKDFLQLVDSKVRVFNGAQKKMYDVDAILEKHNAHPANFVFYRALMGDDSDNISGVRGIKGKTAMKYLPELADPDTVVDFEYVSNKFKDQAKLPVAIQTLLSESALIERNIQLMDLKQQQMSDNSRLIVLRIFNNETPKLNKLALTKAMAASRILSNFTGYDDWITFCILPLTRFYDTD